MQQRFGRALIDFRLQREVLTRLQFYVASTWSWASPIGKTIPHHITLQSVLAFFRSRLKHSDDLLGFRLTYCRSALTLALLGY